MELSGGGWSWMEMGARFSNAPNEIMLLETIKHICK